MEDISAFYEFKLPTKCDISSPDLAKITQFGAIGNTDAKDKVNLAITTMPVKPTTTSIQLQKRYEPDVCIQSIEHVSVPDDFTWRTFGKDQVEKGGIRNQAKCGGCWAFAIAGVLGDKLALYHQIQAPYLSTASMISFGSLIIDGRSGCAGNNVFMACNWFGINDVVLKLENCWPYKIISHSKEFGANTDNVAPLPFVSKGAEDTDEFGKFTHYPSKTGNCCYNCCSDMVKDINELEVKAYNEMEKDVYYIKYFGVDNVSLPSGEYTQKDIDLVIKDIQTNILTYGPVTVSLLVYQDFQDYWNKDAASGKIYERENSEDNSLVGGHAMIIVGWGKDKTTGQRYWEIRNSWGDSGWEHGYAKIAFSTIQNKDQWIGVDIPLYDASSNTYNCGVVSITPEPIENFDKFIKNGVLKKSQYGNLLAKSRALIGGFNDIVKSCANFKKDFHILKNPSGSMNGSPSPIPTKLAKKGFTLTYIIGLIIGLITIILGIWLIIQKLK